MSGFVIMVREAMAESATSNILDFEIHILSLQRDSYPVHIKLGDGGDFAGSLLASDILPWSATGDLAQDGQCLFNVLFADPKLRTAWDATQGRTAQCRFRLWIDAAAAELHTLPWELLHDGDVWLSANARTPFSRYLTSEVPWGGSVVERPIRVLAAVSNPEDIEKYELTPIDVAKEHKFLEDAFAKFSPEQVQLTILESPVTLARLEQALYNGYHVLHFVGHGMFSQRSQQAALYLQDDEGNTQIVNDEHISAILKHQPACPHLIFLAACQTATQATTAAFTGLGPKLIQAGIPAVVAMQDQVSLRTAQQMTPIFYADLMTHGEVDRALNATRNNLLATRRADAVVPVLFMRLQDGQLWRDTVQTGAMNAKIADRNHYEVPSSFWERLRHKPLMVYGILASLVLAVAVLIFPSVWLFATEVLPIGDSALSGMTGEWNVAVAGFTSIGEEPINDKDADLIGAIFYNRFASEMASLGEQTDLIVEVWGPEQTKLILGDTPEERTSNAERNAEGINADMIIYGTIQQIGDFYQLQPEFYVGIENYYEAEELVGYHKFGSEIPIVASSTTLPSQISLNRELSRRSKILALIARGLSLYLIHAYDDALAYFEEANQGQYWEHEGGREVIYLFQGNAAGRALLPDRAEEAYRAAIGVQSEYSRGYVGLGNTSYLQSLVGVTADSFNPNMQDLNLARFYFEQALQAKIKPPTADIPTKVAFGLGQVYLTQWYVGQDTLSQAIERFEFVIQQYNAGENRRVQEFASEAHARLAVIARQQDEVDKAIQEFSTAIELSTDPARRGLYWVSLGDLYSAQERLVEAEAADKNAIQEYTTAVSLTYQSGRRAFYLAEIAALQERLGEIDKAIEALEQAVILLPEESQERLQYQQRIALLKTSR